MKINNLLFAFSSAILLLGYGTDAIASLKKQYKQQSSCSYETATFEGKFGSPARYCITSGNQVLYYFDANTLMGPLFGKVGESEMDWDNFSNSYFIKEYEIDGDKLISYSCLTSNGIDCSGTAKKIVIGTKINNNSNNYSVKIEEGGRTYTFDNGDQYIGKIVNGKEQGKGTYIWADGDSYEGDFLNGNFHGQGTLTYKNDSKYVGKYVGEFKDGSRHGQGTMTYKDGAKYVGEWKDGQRHGLATMTYKDGSEYVGDYLNGYPNGQGTLTYKNDSKYVGKYVGEFKDGSRHGQGTYTSAEGITYEGEWKDGEFVEEN